MALIKTIVVIEHESTIDLHEQLCQAIHEEDHKAIQVLTINVSDITIVEPKKDV